ncbi:MAG: CBS domain-containing protein [Anaerolineae bacterium]|nr:CBS domain-containing protein [Anaerolineae bacterium]
MTHMLMVILVDRRHVPPLLRAWQALGLPGVTMMEGAGAYRATSWLTSVGLGALDRLLEAEEVRRQTLIAVIEDDDLLQRAISEAERVVGGFEHPNTGALFVLPVVEARGIQPRRAPQPPVQEPLPVAEPEWRLRRETLVDEIVPILNLQPTIVKADTTLDEVARALLEHPSVLAACVEDDNGRLIGLVDLESVAEDLFFYILPEEFLSEVVDLEKALAFAKRSRLRTAADAMKPPVWVKLGETVREAFRRMHENHILGLPVVNDQYCVVGFINMLELLTIFIGQSNDSSSPRPAES